MLQLLCSRRWQQSHFRIKAQQPGPQEQSYSLSGLVEWMFFNHRTDSRTQLRLRLLTRHHEPNLLRDCSPQLVEGEAAVRSLVLCQVSIIGYHKGPRILLFPQEGVQGGVKFLAVLCPPEPE